MHPPAAPPILAPVKRRKRWKWLLGGALFLLAAPFAVYYSANWLGERHMEELYRELDADDPHWRWHDLLAQQTPLPDDENSAVQIVKVNALMIKTPFDPGAKWNNAKDPFLHRNARLSREQTELLHAAFAKLDPALVGEARKLKDWPHGRFIVEGVENPFFQLGFDYAQQSRGIVQLLQADAALRADENDGDGAIESCQAILNTAAALRDHPFLITQLVRSAELMTAVAAVERTLGQTSVSEANLKKLQTRLEEESAHDGHYAAMRGERAAGQQMVELMRAGKFSMSELTGGMRIGRPDPASWVLDAFPGVVLNSYPDYLRTMTENVQAAKLPYPERTAAMRKIDEKFMQKRSMLSSMIMPATRKTCDVTQRTQALLRSASAAIAAERYRLKHDRWPAKLDDLVQAGFLKEVPKDPYDGQPLRLTRTPTGLIVYSIGMDQVDNGGKLDRNNPYLSNIDYGFELWDDLPGRSMRGVPAPVE